MIYGSRINDPYEEIRQVFSLPDSAMVGTWVDEDFKDSWYSENLTNSSTEIRTDFSDVSLVDAIWVE